MQDLPDVNRRLVDAVYEALRELILARSVSPGDRLDVDLLAARMKVSRTPVKDALARLASEGLVAVVPRRGTFVQRLTARDVAETFDIRAALEGLAAERIALSIGDREVAELRRMLDDLTERTLDPEAHWLLNATFHRRLVDLVGSQRLAAMYAELQAHLQIARLHRGSGDWHSRAGREAVEHLAIVDALERHDPVAARAAVISHIERAKRSLLSDFEQALQPDGTGEKDGSESDLASVSLQTGSQEGPPADARAGKP